MHKISVLGAAADVLRRRRRTAAALQLHVLTFQMPQSAVYTAGNKSDIKVMMHAYMVYLREERSDLGRMPVVIWQHYPSLYVSW